MYEVSVIIPVYNSEKYIDRCFKSLINQTSSSFCVIAVDDGSSDGSYDKLLHYKEQLQDQMLLLQKKNGGAASARNLALKHVKTPYVMFCDIDDYVEPDYIEVMCRSIRETNADMVCCGYAEESKTQRRECERKSYSSIPADDKDIICNIDVVLWNKIYKTQIWTKNEITMPEGIIFEDNAVIPIVSSYCKKIVWIENVLYHYDITVESSVMHKSRQRVEDLLRVAEVLNNARNKANFSEQYQYLISENIFAYIAKIALEKESGVKIKNAYKKLEEYGVEVLNNCYFRQLKRMNRNRRLSFSLMQKKHIMALRLFLIARKAKNLLIRE